MQMGNERAFLLDEQSVIRVRKRRIATTKLRNDLLNLKLFHPVQRNGKKQSRIEAPEEKDGAFLLCTYGPPTREA
jgi:hypothetical protein